MGYDFYNVGDNDLNLGIKKLQLLAKKAQFSFLSANIVDESHPGKRIFFPYKIMEIGEIKIGFIGLCSPPHKKKTGIKVLNPIDAYKKYYPIIRSKCDYVMAVIALNATDEFRFIKSDISCDLIISANQYRYSQFIQSKGNNKVAFTGHSGKHIVKISGFIENKALPLKNSSELLYRHKINQRRLERYRKIAKGKELQDYYKDQPAVLKMLNRLQDNQKEITENIHQLINPLSLDMIDVELEIPPDKEIRERIEQVKRKLKSE